MERYVFGDLDGFEGVSEDDASNFKIILNIIINDWLVASFFI